jgi:predicted phosphodiesterase
MTIVRFIGDVHGAMKKYKKIIKSAPENVSLQLGDFGVGFYRPYTDIRMGQNPPYDYMAAGKHYFIRGNHDNPGVCAKHPFWVKDGTYAPNVPDVFCIGGATSIDREYRTEGYTWWEGEELSYGEWLRVMDTWEKEKPDIVATHDVPDEVVRAVVAPRAGYTHFYKSRTCQALQSLFDIHRPAICLHGHHHISYRQVYKGTEFIGVGECDYIDLEI